MQFNLKQLQHLVLLADEKSFARAAMKAKLSQSAFSRSIQTLESSVNMRLVERGLKHVKPTDVGQHIVDRARRLLEKTGDLSRELDLLRSGDLGDLSIGAGALAGAAVLSGPLARLHQAHPGVLVDVEVIESHVIMERLLRSGLDFFVGEFSEISVHKDIHVDVLGKMSARFFCRTGHPLASGESISLKELVKYPLASVHIPIQVMKMIRGYLREGRYAATELPLQSGSLTILRDYALKSDVVILGTEGPFEVEVHNGLLVSLRVLEFEEDNSNNPISAEVAILTISGRTPSPAGKLLMEMIREEAQLTFAPAPQSPRIEPKK